MPQAPPPATATGVVHASVDALAHVAAAPVPLEVTLPLPPSPAASAPALDPKFYRLRAWLLDNGASGPGIDRWRVARSPLGGHGIFTDYGLEQSETLANVPARSTVVRCRRDEKRVLGDALSDVAKRIREIR